MASFSTDLLFLCFLVFANSVVAVAETAVVKARKSRLKELADAGSARAARALSIVEQPSRFLAFAQFWLTVSAMIAGVVVGTRIAGVIELWLADFPAIAAMTHGLALVIAILGVTTVMVLIGDLLPKRIGRAYPETVAVWVGVFVDKFVWLTSPVLRLLDLATTGLEKLLRVKPREASENVAEEDVRALVEQGLHAGVFHRAEKEMVERVLALDQQPVTALMTPRPKIVFLNIDEPEEVNWRKIVTSGHSYFPVYQGHRDQIVGMVAVKALWAHSAIGLPTTLKNLLLPPLLVSETTFAIQLLEQFKKSGRHIAIVVDEFGAVQGLVTLIDVLEAIVGDLPERGRLDQPETKRRDDGSWLIDATLTIEDLKKTIGFTGELPHEKDAEYQTVGGLMLTQLGRIPQAGDFFTWEGWRFEVVDMDRRRVDKVLVAQLPPQTTEPAA
ncbi:MAG: hemolysin family protein [Opitutus sp.]|nr:hemolysin family protein [Opitutus sp.]